MRENAVITIVLKWRRPQVSTQSEITDSQQAHIFIRPGPALCSWLRRKMRLDYFPIALSRRRYTFLRKDRACVVKRLRIILNARSTLL